MTTHLEMLQSLATQIEDLMAERTEHVIQTATIDAKVKELELEMSLITGRAWAKPVTQIVVEKNNKLPRAMGKTTSKPTQPSLNFNYQLYPTREALAKRMEEVYDDFMRLHVDWREVKNSVWTAERIQIILDNYNAYSHDSSVKTITRKLNDKKGNFTENAVNSRIKTLMLSPEVNTRWSEEQAGLILKLAFLGDKKLSKSAFGEYMAIIAETGSPVDSIFCYIRGAANRRAVEESSKRSLKKVSKKFKQQNLSLGE